MILLIRL